MNDEDEQDLLIKIPLTVFGVSEYIAQAIIMGDIALAYDLLLSKLHFEPNSYRAKAYGKHKRVSAWIIKASKL